MKKESQKRHPPWSLERDLACCWTWSTSGSDGRRSLTVHAGVESSKSDPTGLVETPVQGGWTEDFNKLPLFAGAAAWRSSSLPAPKKT